MNISKLALLAAAAMFVACGSRNQTANHDEHEGHTHAHHEEEHHHEEVHNHEAHHHSEHEEHAHEGDDHSASHHEEHNHDAEHNTPSHSHEGHDHSAHTEGEIILTEEQAAAAGVETQRVEVSEFVEVIPTSGIVESAQGSRTAIVAPASGVITCKNLYVGSRVRAGQTIATLSGRRIAEGDPAEQVRIDYELAQKELARAESLIADKIISQQEYDRIKTNYELASQRYQALASEGEEGIVVKAPSDGYVVEMLVANGDYVSTGQTLCRITAGNRMTLTADLPVSMFNRVESLSGANFRLPYGSNVYSVTELGGRIEAIGRCADGAAYLPVTFVFNAPSEVLSGSFAEVWLLGTPREGVVSLPKEALSEEQGLYFVYERIDGECYRKREVKLGGSDGERVEIVGDELLGREVVVKGTIHVKLAANATVIPEGHSHNH